MLRRLDRPNGVARGEDQSVGKEILRTHPGPIADFGKDGWARCERCYNGAGRSIIKTHPSGRRRHLILDVARWPAERKAAREQPGLSLIVGDMLPFADKDVTPEALLHEAVAGQFPQIVILDVVDRLARPSTKNQRIVIVP